MRFTTESCFAHPAQFTAMLEDHWQEVAKNKTLMQLRPDWDRYKLIEDAGKLLTIYAWEDGKMVGYSSTIVDTHMHYSGLIIASNDVLFVAKGARGNTGLRLMRETEALVKARGAKLMLWHAKEDSALDCILKAKGLAVQDIIYSKEL